MIERFAGLTYRECLCFVCVVFLSPACKPDPHDGLLFIRPPFADCAASSNEVVELTIASWNIAAAQRGPLEEVRDELAELDADVVLLQEVDVGMTRSGGVNQASELGDPLGYDVVFASALADDGGHYGLAILSKVPFADVQRIELRDALSSEPRIALDAQLCVGETALRAVTTHIDFRRDAAADQLDGVGETLGDLGEMRSW